MPEQEWLNQFLTLSSIFMAPPVMFFVVGFAVGSIVAIIKKGA